MKTVQEILDFLWTVAPRERREDWDNVGLACGRASATVSKVLISLDPSLDAIAEARETGAELVVSHHPMTMDGLKQANDQSLPGLSWLWAIENGVAVVNLHTNLDCADGGVNDCLAAALGLRAPEIVCEPGKAYGYLRVGGVEPQPREAFLQLVKQRLGCPGLRYTAGKETVRRVAVGGGACGSMLEEAAARGCDTFVTADCKYNHFLDAAALGMNLIDAGHFETENVVCPYLRERISENFPDLTVVLSKKHRDPIRFL